MQVVAEGPAFFTWWGYCVRAPPHGAENHPFSPLPDPEVMLVCVRFEEESVGGRFELRILWDPTSTPTPPTISKPLLMVGFFWPGFSRLMLLHLEKEGIGDDFDREYF